MAIPPHRPILWRVFRSPLRVRKVGGSLWPESIGPAGSILFAPVRGREEESPLLPSATGRTLFGHAGGAGTTFFSSWGTTSESTEHARPSHPYHEGWPAPVSAATDGRDVRVLARAAELQPPITPIIPSVGLAATMQPTVDPWRRSDALLPLIGGGGSWNLPTQPRTAVAIPDAPQDRTPQEHQGHEAQYDQRPRDSWLQGRLLTREDQWPRDLRSASDGQAGHRILSQAN